MLPKYKKKNNFTYVLTALVLLIGLILCLIYGIKVSQVMVDYNFSVIIILIVMDLFTNIIITTGAMQKIAVKLATLSNGNLKKCLILFGMLMFFISAFLNNITAVMVILPIIFVLLKALDIDKRYLCIFFATILSLSNTGGAASPIGDFPALIIMTSGITTFMNYLIRAFPVFLITSCALCVIWLLAISKKQMRNNTKTLAIDFIQSRFKHLKVNYDALIPISLVLLAMFIAWSTFPPDVLPPEVIAVIGYISATIVALRKKLEFKQLIDMKSVLLISVFLFMATCIKETGMLVLLANYFKSSISNPQVLLIVMMLITSLSAGLFSAGPAAAAMMPIIVDLCNTTFISQSHWIAIGYAASICAGSSLFLWSATAGFILSEKIENAKIEIKNTTQMWGIKEYFKYGIINYIVQMTIALGFMLIVT